MGQQRICPECGAELPDDSSSGLYPKCIREEHTDGASSSAEALTLGHASSYTAEPTGGKSSNSASGEDATLGPNAEAVDEASPIGIKVRDFGDYELQEEIARGGMGIVYKARHVKLNRIVALKMILGGRFSSSDEVKRFHVEAEAAARLDHPGIVPIYEIGQHEGQHFFAMKFIEGASLADRRESLRGNRRGAVRIIAEVARAVHHAHQRGILHRDLKPANILMDSASNPLVTDLGLAKNTADESDLTNTGSILGTPSYMPPEQASGQGSVTTAADIYALGAILYELLTGQPPYRGTTPLETVMRVLEEPLKPPRQLEPKLERDLELICVKCLERQPDSRYASAAELADDLDSWLAGDQISVRPPTASALVGRWLRHNRQLVFVIVALLLGILFSLPIISTIAGTGLQEAYEPFPEVSRPWIYSFERLIPKWVSGLSAVFLLLLWPTIGLLNATVARPATITRAIGTGVFSAFMCAIVLSVLLGWIMFVGVTGQHARHHVLTLAKVAWPPDAQNEEQARRNALELVPGLESVAEEDRAAVLARRILADEFARGPEWLMTFVYFCCIVAGPIIYGTVFGHMLLSKGNALWLVTLRYFVAWLAATVAYFLMLLKPSGGFNFTLRFMGSGTESDYPVWVLLVILSAALLIAFVALRDWKRRGKGG